MILIFVIKEVTQFPKCYNMALQKMRHITYQRYHFKPNL